MRHILAVVVAVVAALSFSPAHAETSSQARTGPGCVTHSEYRAIRHGWTKHHVDKRVGATGAITYAPHRHIVVDYKACEGWRAVYVQVRFDRRVYAKRYIDGMAAGAAG